VLHLIGQGCFGKVFKGRRRYTGKIVALKFISKRGKPEKDLQNLRIEIGILQRLDHKNIVRMLDYFETNTDFVVVTEFAYGELFDIFQDDKYLPEDQVRSISRQLVMALEYLHSEKIIHRDMKPQNVLVGADDAVKLCDFGFARAMSHQTTVLTSIKGTPLYMAPELVQERPYDCKADLWSLGVICYELNVGQPPFYTNSLISLIHLIVDKPVKYPDNMSPDLISFLQALLQKDPRQRMGWPDLSYHPFIVEKRTPLPAPSSRVSRPEHRPLPGGPPKENMPTQPAAPTQALPQAVGTAEKHLAGFGKWLPLFAEALAGPQNHAGLARGGASTGGAVQAADESFANLCLAGLKVYAELLEGGLLKCDTPQLEHQGIIVRLVGDVQQQPSAIASLPLSVLVRGLAHLLGLQSPPAATVQRLLASTTAATLLLRIAHVLCGEHAVAWGPPWDLISDCLRLLGLWLRAPIALYLNELAEELLRPTGVLVQYMALAPTVLAGGVTGCFSYHGAWFTGATGVHHLGTAVNSVKCLGVVFTHLSQAVASHPPSAHAMDLFLSLGDDGGNFAQLPKATGDMEAPVPARAIVLAVQAVCQCLLFRSSPGAPGERLVRAALQAVAALLHPSSGGPERAGLPWGGEGSHRASWTGADVAQLEAAICGAREVVRGSLRTSLTEARLCAPGFGEVDDELLMLLWDLRTTLGGERLDASALKVLMGLVNLSPDLARRFAGLRAVAQSLAPNSSIGPGAALAAVEATCAGAADQNPAAAWPAVGLLLAVLTTSLRPCGELPHTSIDTPDQLATRTGCAPLPEWCSVVIVQALGARLQSALSRPPETVLPMLCACYALELLAALCTALIFRSGASVPQIRRELLTIVSQAEGVIESVVSVIVKGRVGRQCLDDMRKAEGMFYRYLTRGPLDGVLSIVATLHELENPGIEDERVAGPQQRSSLACRTVFLLVSVEDPQAVLSVVGPRGLLRLLDLVYCFRDVVEPSVVSLRFCLSILWALRSCSVLPHGDLAGLPHLASAFQASVDLVLRIFSIVSQRQVGPGAVELHSDFQNFQSIPTVMHFFAGIPHVDPRGWQAMGEVWWRALTAGMQLLSTLVLHHHALAHEFVQGEGLRMLVERRLLALEFVTADANNSHIVVDALLIVSQLSRLSKEYYPMLHRMNVCEELRDLLGCGNANIRAKACNAIGNMARHSDYFYGTLQQAAVLPQLIPLCADSDSTCRKFASFAVGNAAFHSDLLYKELALAIPKLMRLLEDQEEKTRANAAGAIGNLVRNSAELCGAMIRSGALQGLYNLVDSRRPRDGADPGVLERFVADSSVKIALFSLGNLAVHGECRNELRTSIKAADLCHLLIGLCSPDEIINKYAKRLLQKLAG